jgi:hypothetical protein
VRQLAAVVASVGVILAAACTPTDNVRPDRAPPEVGGRLSIGGLTIGGGDNYGYKGTLSESEERLREQGRRFDKTVWQGALIGAVAGTLIGAAAGGDAEDALGGAIVGAGIGALAGMYVAHKQKQFASAEDQLDSIIEDVQASNRETQALIESAESVLDEDRRRLSAIEARYRQGQVAEDELVRERSRAWANRKVVEQAALGAGDQYRMFEGAQRNFTKQNPGARTGTLEQELVAYRRNLDVLNSVAQSMGKA